LLCLINDRDHCETALAYQLGRSRSCWRFAKLRFGDGADLVG
jgi:hypothetical protein